jgi:ribosome modulation factor
MMHTKLEMYAYAEGYHHGRCGRMQDCYFEDKECRDLYKEGYANGVEDRDEEDER